MKLIALESMDPAQMAKALSRYAVKKTAGGINNYQAERKAQPERTGGTTVPVKPEHKGLMGQPQNPHGTIHDKRGRATKSSPLGVEMLNPSSGDSTRPTLVNLGQPFTRRLSDNIVGDGAGIQPVDKESGDYTTRREGPAEDPGRVRTGTLGFNRSKQGLTRYMG